MRLKLETGNYMLLPVDPIELTFEQVEDFKALRRGMKPADENATELEKAEETVTYMLEALGALNLGAVSDLPLSLPGDDMKAMVEERFMIGMKFLQGKCKIKGRTLKPELSVMRMYVHVCNMIDYWQPKTVAATYKIKWKGEWYHINPQEAINALTGRVYTAGEAITVLELQKKTQAMIDNHGDKQGNLAFSLGLQEFAILMRKKDEPLPVNRRERIRFIDKRVKLFNDLPYSVVLKARFFLLRILTAYVKTQLTNSFLKDRPKPTDGLVRGQMRHARNNVVKLYKRQFGK